MTHATGEAHPFHANMHGPDEVDIEHKPIQVEVVNQPEMQQSVTQSHVSFESMLITAAQIIPIPANPYRKRLCIWTDSLNTTPVYVGRNSDAFAGVAPFPKAVALAANSGIFEFTHTAGMAVFSTANATLYYYEERYAVDS